MPPPASASPRTDRAVGSYRLITDDLPSPSRHASHLHPESVPGHGRGRPGRRRNRTGRAGPPRISGCATRWPPCALARALQFRPDRLPAQPRPAHPERPGRRRRGAGPAAMRVLCPGGHQRPGPHHRDGQARPQSGPPPARDRADHVRSAQQPVGPGRGRCPRLLRRRPSTTPSSPAISASPRRRATASRCCSTISARPAPRPMSGWPAKCCAASAPHGRHQPA